MLLKYLESNKVNSCFDVGANTGQYGKLLRSAGFKGKIFSFEPQSAAFEKLRKNSSTDPNWSVYNLGIGDKTGKSVINISKNSVSSSILDIDSFLVETEPETKYIAKETIKISRLDQFLSETAFNERLFLKIDAQGFESKILEGAEDCFGNIYAMQLELSYVSLYHEEKLFDEMKEAIESRGFYLSSVESGFADVKTGRLLQIETIFLRES